MTTTSYALLAVATVVLAAIGNLLANWFAPPGWMTPRRRWTAIGCCVVVLAVIAVAAVLDSPRAGPGEKVGPAPADPRPEAPVTVAGLVPTLAAKRVLTIDDSAGRPTLYTSRLDGRDRRVLWDAPDSWPAIPLDGDRLLLAAPWEERGNDRLEVFTARGEFVRALSDPPAGQSDASPALASRAKQVYFIRNTWRDEGGGTSTLTSSRVMRVPVAGGGAREVPVPGVQLRTVSVAADGRLAAGQCVVGEGEPMPACVVDTTTGRSTIVRPEEPATTDGVSISPDGGWLAYSAPVTNPYGESQIFVYDIGTRETTMVTRMAGRNVTPAWIPAGDRACLVFEHYERAAGSSIHLACLRPAPATVLAIPIGSRPVWFG
ncbi:hypothetical protein AB0F59_31120 [Micromonospora lupini]|uniref:hypothetical protein n=1 Tax=Micromonospora lupini TaxID=285679 RepID=UPI00340F2000